MKIYPLFNLPEDLLPSVGGKARGLYLLNKAGLPVADGFCIAGVNESDLQEYADYFEKSGLERVAVRSSATDEDGAVFSGAGLYETVLNVSGRENFISAVETCVKSLQSARAQTYTENFAKESKAQMNVVVQKMVDAKTAGVAFSVDPTDSGVMLVEAVEGLGETLVSGKGKSKQYKFAKAKDSRVFYGDGLLSAELQKSICDGLDKAKETLGCEADCEWAVDKDGNLFWLQARPITADEMPTVGEFDCKRDLSERVVTSCNVGEMLPGAITPLSLSTSIYALDYGIRNMLALAGVIKKPSDLPAYSCILSVKNHLFIDMTTLYSISRNVMMASKESIDLAICGRALEFGDTKEKRAGFFRRLKNGIKYIKILTGAEKSKKKLTSITEKFVFFANENAQAVYDEIDKMLPLMHQAMWYHYNTSSHSGAMNGALNMMLKDAYADTEQIKAMVAGTLEGIDNIESVAILADLQDIAQEILKEFPEANCWQAAEVSNYFENSGKGSAADELLQKFLSRHGHRAIREAELRSKAWRDDKPALYGYIATVLSAQGQFARENADRDSWMRNVEEMAKPLKKSMKKGVNFVVKQCRKGVVNREYSKSYIIKIIDTFKQRYRLLADMLVYDGLLPDADAIYFLMHEEIGKLLKGDASLVKKCVVRRRLLDEQNSYVFPDVSRGMPQPIVFEEMGKSDFCGVPVSRGKVKGVARVVKSPQDAKQLQKGEIMIAEFTDIGWSPYYCLISALVTEVGSALSHGAVVAREYGLPVVVNIPFATELIKTGDIVSVDGSTGKVVVLNDSMEPAVK